MNKSHLRALVCAIAMSAAFAARATPVTYSFTGVAYGYAAFAGQTVTGSYTYDPSRYTGYASDEATYGQSYINGAPNGSATATVHLSGGFVDTVDGPGTPLGVSYQTIVTKSSLTDSFELYATSSDAGGATHAIELFTGQSGSRPDAIFPGSSRSDYAATQPVSFLTPGSSHVGYFVMMTPDGSAMASDFVITSISVVPEPASALLMLAGAALLGLRDTRRRNA